MNGPEDRPTRGGWGSSGGGRRGLAGRAAALAALLLGPVPGAAAAQEDYRAADLDRPIRVEDAFPVKLYEWEAKLGARAGLTEGGGGVLALLELETGAFLNTEVGIGVELGVEEDRAGRSRGGLEKAEAHLLYNFNRETRSWPAFGARLDVATPGAGALGREGWSVGLKGIATRSFDRLRVHANGGYAVAAEADGDDYWRAGVAFDYPIGLFSRGLLGDLYVELPAHEGRSRVWLELGTRWQLGNDEVFDFGLATRLDEWEAGSANVELVVGISHLFGVPGLLRVPPYPSPRLR